MECFAICKNKIKVSPRLYFIRSLCFLCARIVIRAQPPESLLMLWGLRGSSSGESRLTPSVRRFLSTYILHLNTWCESSWSRGGNPSAAALSQLHPAQYQLLNLHTPLTMIQTFRFHRWFVRSEPIWASGGGYSFPICGGDSFFNLFPIYANYHMNYLNAELQLNLFHPVKCCSSDVNHNQSLELIPNSCWDSEQHVVCKGAWQTWGSVNIPSSIRTSVCCDATFCVFSY